MNAPASKLTLSQRKRMDILNAARQELLETGFRDTSMDRIAERAQVSKRTVYNHFPSKETLFAAIIGEFIRDMQQAITVEYDSGLPLDQQLREIAMREVEQVTSEDYIAVFRVFLAELSNFPDMFKEVLAANASGHNPVEDWMQGACDDNRLAIANVPLAANQFVSMLKGALFWPLMAGYGEPASAEQCKAVIDGAVAMFLDHYQT